MFELFPDSYRVRLLRGEAFEKANRHDYEKALEEYRTALKLNPDVAGVQFAVGRILWKMNRFEEAVPYLQRELARNANHGLANFYLGNTFLRQGDAEKALSHLDAAIKAQPAFGEAYRSLGRALVALGRHDEAIDSLYRTAVQRP